MARRQSLPLVVPCERLDSGGKVARNPGECESRRPRYLGFAPSVTRGGPRLGHDPRDVVGREEVLDPHYEAKVHTGVSY